MKFFPLISSFLMSHRRWASQLVLAVFLVGLSLGTGFAQTPAATPVPTASTAPLDCPLFDDCRTRGIFSRGNGFVTAKQALKTECQYAQTIALAAFYLDQYVPPATTNDAEIPFVPTYFGNQVPAFDRLASWGAGIGCKKEAYVSLTDDFKNFRGNLSDQIERTVIHVQQDSGETGRSYLDALILAIDTAVKKNYNVDANNLANLKQTIFGFAALTDIYNPDIAAIPSSRVLFQTGGGTILGKDTPLKDYTNGALSGREQFRTVVERILWFVKRVLTPIYIFLIVFMGVELFMGGRSSADEELSKKKKQFFAMTNGFILFALVTTFVDFVVFGNEGEIFRDNYIGGNYVLDEALSNQAAQRGFEQLEGFFTWLETIWVIISVLFLVTSAMRLLFGGGSDDAQGKVKKHVLYSIISLVFVISARPVLNIFTTGGNRFSTPTVTPLIEFLIKWADYILGFVGFLGVIALIYAGIRLIVGFGDEEAVTNAKKVGQYALMGLALAFSAWTIINFFANPSGTGLQTSF